MGASVMGALAMGA
jgi:hypothetical protein